MTGKGEELALEYELALSISEFFDQALYSVSRRLRGCGACPACPARQGRGDGCPQTGPPAGETCRG